MDFGHIPYSELDIRKLKLPGDSPLNGKILKGRPDKKAKLFIGCAKWGRKEWVGKLYPKGTKEKNFLDQYVKHFNSIELNASHYKVYGASATAAWAVRAERSDFVFCPKMYKGITHFGNLGTKKFLLNEFLRGVDGLGDKLGPIFIQLSDRFGPKRKEELFAFLKKLPADKNFFLELRHPDWFSDKKLEAEVFLLLKKLKIGAVITDTAGRRDLVHMQLPVAKAFIRFVGNELHATDYKRADAWVKRIKLWMDNGIKELYFFMHMQDETFTPELVEYVQKKLRRYLTSKSSSQRDV
ncbi:MAG: DUF72 domain-containing protein [Gemmatimonadaceae bacterium]|nr:DUF72 domain-containing protein [Chitinophagaceae bacterium]